MEPMDEETGSILRKAVNSFDVNVVKLNQNLSKKSDLLSVKYIFVSVGVNVRFSLAKAAYWCLIRILNNTSNHQY